MRDIQNAVLNDLAANHKSIRTLMPNTQSSYIHLPSQKRVMEGLSLFIKRHYLQKEGYLKGSGLGLNGFYLQGSPGVGKSKMLAQGLQYAGYMPKDKCKPTSQCWYDKIDASLPEEIIKQRILEAMEQGQAAWVEEGNAIFSDGMERWLNAVLTGDHPNKEQKVKPGFMLFITGNPATLKGRDVLSPALLHRCEQFIMPELKKSDLENVFEQIMNDVKRIAQTVIKLFASAFHSLMTAMGNINLRTIYQERIFFRQEMIKVKKLLPASLTPKSKPVSKQDCLNHRHDKKTNAATRKPTTISKEDINTLLEAYEPSYFFSRATFLSCFGKQYCSHTTQVLNRLAHDISQESFTKQEIISELKKNGAIEYRIDALSADWTKEGETPKQYLLGKGGKRHSNTGTNKLLVELIKHFHPNATKYIEREEPRGQARLPWSAGGGGGGGGQSKLKCEKLI